MIDRAGLSVDGVSVGGFASCLDVPELNLCVDLGVVLDRTIARDFVLVTHAHADHLGSLVQHVAQRRLRGMHPATYVVPPEIVGDVEELLGIWRRLDGGALRAVVRPLEPGESFDLRRDLGVRPFETVHRVPSQGYLLERVSKRLAEEHRGIAPEAIAEMKREGVVVDEVVREPVIAISGDTTIEGLTRNPEVLRAPRLVVEATFLDELVDADKAEQWGHIHLDHIAAIAERIECRALLLNHVSARYSGAEARRLVDQRLPPDLAARTQVMVAGVAPDHE
ncbi:MAG: MBL fold metallo-hydrolase [Planctomycetota bacterium]